ncbi:hypothetical protein [Dyadobacter frigoris]|uniref:CN hydrolase domain-containing protein n=1 Tax=Dyadobacter frigoris TaxID=2576211 RepID=A0A4U6DAA7_9BACT|nr:hypothetical protein [Dyadobacter frigoris]TKT93321.1 hypothetical protein FDK13_05570 [Dyadobacter frigoris]
MTEVPKFEIIETLLPSAKRENPEFVNVMVFQTEYSLETDYKKINDLYYHRNMDKIKYVLLEALAIAKKDNVHLLVFPELSIPEELIPLLQNWSKCNHELVIVAGSHYHCENEDKIPISRCPVIHNGDVYYTHKIVPADDELSINLGYGLKEGSQILKFSNSPVGKFVVLICSDNLENSVRVRATNWNFDFLVVIAAQKKSEDHWMPISQFVNEGTDPKYVIYANNKISLKHPKSKRNSVIITDGRSSFFGVTSPQKKDQLVDRGNTNFKPKGKLVEITGKDNYYFLKANIKNKNPSGKPTVALRGNTMNIDQVVCLEAKIDNLVALELSGTRLMYQNALEQIEKIELDPSNYGSFLYPDLIKTVQFYLDKYSVLILIGPIQVGKTTMLNIICHSLSEKIHFVPIIDSSVFSLRRKKIDKIDSLFFLWYSEIVDYVLALQNKHRVELSPNDKSRIAEQEIFLDWLGENRFVGETNLQAFLRTIELFKESVGYRSGLYLGIRLDEVQKYVSEAVFTEFNEFLSTLNSTTLQSFTTKLIIASRYFPGMNFKRNSLIYVPHFETEVVKNLTALFSFEMEQEIQDEFIELIIEKTDGYPWFVMRFLKIYLRHRIQDNFTNPIELSHQIYNQGSFWVSDSFFLSESHSHFVNELTSLLKTSDKVSKDEFKRFIRPNSSHTELNNGWSVSKDYLVKQSGFFKINLDSGQFENNGCFLLSTHFKDLALNHE